MKTTKYEIKLPTLPDGRELVCNQQPVGDDLVAYWNDINWEWRASFGPVRYPFIARRRETLADWANKQRLFQALAEMRKGKETIIETSGACVWGFGADKHGDWYDFEMGTPPANLTGKLRLEAGKWVDAT